MKPEAVKFLLDIYLSQKNCCTTYDEVDGISYTPRRYDDGSLSGNEPGLTIDGAYFDQAVQPGIHFPVELNAIGLNAEEEEIAKDFGRQLSDMSDEFEQIQISTQSHSDTDGNMFEFEKKCLFISRPSDKVEIPIVRVGKADKEFTVKWITKDKTAMDGRHYKGGEGEVEFKIGEMKKVIEIPLLRNYEKDTCFIVELLDSNSVEIGYFNPININFADFEGLYDDERNVIDNIIESRRFSFDHVKSCLQRNVTVDTFKTALTFLCSNADSVHQEFAYAFELTNIALKAAPKETLLKVLCNYFRSSPDLEQLRQNQDDEMSENSDSDSEID